MRTLGLFAAWHGCSGQTSQPTSPDDLTDGECEAFSGAVCDDVIVAPSAERVDLIGEVCRDPSHELPVCLLPDDLVAACLQWFDGSGLTTCPPFREFVEATGWVAGEESVIARAEVRRCDSRYSDRQYESYFWSDHLEFYGDFYSYSHLAYFDTDSGELVSVQNYQSGASEFGIYPELWCCEGELTFGTVAGSPVAVDCTTSSSHQYEPSEFASARR